MNYKALLEVPATESDVYYWVDVLCTNCGLFAGMAFRKNLLIKDHHCPTCENETLVRNEK